MAGLPWRSTAEGLTLALHVTPRASRNEIGGLETRADGTQRLRVRVTAAPEAGKANAAVIAILARAWRLPKSALERASGQASRDKTLRIHGDSDTLAATLRAAIL